MDLTILEYLQGKSNDTLSDSVLNVIAFDRGVEDVSEDVSTLSLQTKELMFADILLQQYTGAKSVSESKEHKGFAERTQKVFGDSNAKLEIAKSIYKKYSDPMYETIVSGTKNVIEIITITDSI